jgi:type II secretion system protein I
MKRRRARGFTLLEVLVATTIMAAAIVSLLSALSTSLNNASRLTDSDRAAVLAKRTMDELIAAPGPAPGQLLQGQFDPRATGIAGGWRARIEALERVPGGPVRGMGVDRIVLEIWWMQGDQRRAFQLEGFRRGQAEGGRAW